MSADDRYEGEWLARGRRLLPAIRAELARRGGAAPVGELAARLNRLEGRGGCMSAVEALERSGELRLLGDRRSAERCLVEAAGGGQR